MRAHLATLVAVALISGTSDLSSDGQRVQALAVGIIMAIATVLALVNKLCRFKQKWFQCRAIAETVKSATWRYVMTPADDSERAKAAVGRFQAQLRDLAARFPGVRKWLTTQRTDGSVVSAAMDKVQRLSPRERVALYTEERLRDQRSFYVRNAKHNVRLESFWLWAVVLAQVAAFLAAYMHWQHLWRFNPVGGLSAVAAAFIAWTQTKRHTELGESYSAAACDLEVAEVAASDIAEEDALAEFVEDVEGACSREHSLWLARRTA